MTAVAAYSYAHSVTYVADNVLKSLKDIIRLSGLNPERFAQHWPTYTLGVKTWLETGDLQEVLLEIYEPGTNALITRWDIRIAYGAVSGDGAFWTDTDQLKYAILKAGVLPSVARYDLILITRSGRPAVAGWSTTTLRSTGGMVRQSLGATVEHGGIGAHSAYWRAR